MFGAQFTHGPMCVLLFFFTLFLRAANGQFNPDCSRDFYFPPRCESGQNDPLTNQPCTPYRYDCIWSVTEAQVGTHRRLEVNGVWPPPAIQVEQGERIRIALFNNLPDETRITLHFHGLLQESGYDIMDGPQHLTQGGLRRGQVFVYDFPATKAGTYWIHSHAPGQYPKGLRSPLIVTKSSDKDATNWNYNADSEVFDKVITLSDHWENFWTAQQRYEDSKCGKGIEVPPEYQLFNDRAPLGANADSRQKVLLKSGVRYRLRFVNMAAISRYYVWIQDIDMEVIEIDGVMVKPGVKTKGIELASGQRVSVVVQIDSATTLKRIMAISDRRIAQGQTDKEAYCKLTPTSQWSDMQYAWGWLVNNDNGRGPYTYTVPDQSEIEGYGRWMQSWNDGTYIYPFYRYRPKLPFIDQHRVGVDITKPCGNSKCTCDTHDNCLWNPLYAWDFYDAALKPDPPLAAMAPTAYTSAYIHEISLEDDADGYGIMGLETPKRFIAPDKQDSSIPKKVDSNSDNDYPRLPTLLRALWSATTPSDLENPSRYSYDSNQVTQTIIMKKDEVHWFAFRTLRGDHPVHMHGHEFQIITRLPVETTAGPEYRVKRFNEFSHNYNNIPLDRNPARRDTIMVEKGTTLIVAIKATNPGVWALHCHNDFHAETGMFMQLIEDPTALRDKLGRVEFEKGTGGTWNFKVKLLDWSAKQGISKWLWQNVKKTFTSYGYFGLDVTCGNGACPFTGNPGAD